MSLTSAQAWTDAVCEVHSAPFLATNQHSPLPPYCGLRAVTAYCFTRYAHTSRWAQSRARCLVAFIAVARGLVKLALLSTHAVRRPAGAARRRRARRRPPLRSPRRVA